MRLLNHVLWFIQEFWRGLIALAVIAMAVGGSLVAISFFLFDYHFR